MTDTETRTNYTAGLRALADLLDANPDLPLPYTGRGSALNWIEYDKASAARFAHLIPGTVTKTARGDSIDLEGQIAGLKVCFIASREAVCERIITGTHEITTPARPALNLPAEPEHTETVEDVQWVCSSLLAESVPA